MLIRFCLSASAEIGKNIKRKVRQKLDPHIIPSSTFIDYSLGS